MTETTKRGWGIFWNQGSIARPKGLYEIERLDEADVFETDDQAFDHICRNDRQAGECIQELLDLATNLRHQLQEVMAINERRPGPPPIPERYCPTHGQQPGSVWACPVCFIEMRQELRLLAPHVRPPRQEEEVVWARINVGHFASLVEEELRNDGYYDNTKAKEAAARIAKLARLHYLRITPTSHKE